MDVIGILSFCLSVLFLFMWIYYIRTTNVQMKMITAIYNKCVLNNDTNVPIDLKTTSIPFVDKIFNKI